MPDSFYNLAKIIHSYLFSPSLFYFFWFFTILCILYLIGAIIIYLAHIFNKKDFFSNQNMNPKSFNEIIIYELLTSYKQFFFFIFYNKRK